MLLAILPLHATLAAEPLAIAAGAGYKRPVVELAQAFERQAGIQVESFFGNMGQVMAQAVQSERVALVFGDQAFLDAAKQLRFERYLSAGKGRLVLAWPKGRSLSQAGDLTQPAFIRIALPDMRHAVYGKAAAEYLEHSGLGARVNDRLLTVATVPQVSAYLVSGEVDAGFINLTDAIGVRDRIGGFIEIDPALYGEIRIVAGVVEGRSQLSGVSELAAFLETPEAKAILARHGL